MTIYSSFSGVSFNRWLDELCSECSAVSKCESITTEVVSQLEGWTVSCKSMFSAYKMQIWIKYDW